MTGTIGLVSLYFAEKHQVVAIDLAGHESGLQRTEWTISQFGGDVASVADQLALITSF